MIYILWVMIKYYKAVKALKANVIDGTPEMQAKLDLDVYKRQLVVACARSSLSIPVLILRFALSLQLMIYSNSL